MNFLLFLYDVCLCYWLLCIPASLTDTGAEILNASILLNCQYQCCVRCRTNFTAVLREGYSLKWVFFLVLYLETSFLVDICILGQLRIIFSIFFYFFGGHFGKNASNTRAGALTYVTRLLFFFDCLVFWNGAVWSCYLQCIFFV